MTLDEAKLVGKLIGHADGGCPNCVHDLVKRASATFPQFTWACADRAEKVPSTDFDWAILVTVTKRPHA